MITSINQRKEKKRKKITNQKTTKSHQSKVEFNTKIYQLRVGCNKE